MGGPERQAESSGFWTHRQLEVMEGSEQRRGMIWKQVWGT